MRSLRKLLVFSFLGALASGFAFEVEDAKAAKIAGGERQSCAITAAGGVMCWGQQSSGSLGNGQAKGSSPTPVQVVGIKSGATAVAGTTTGNGGSQYACAIVSGGVKCWGTGGYGTLGDGAKKTSLVPVQVTGLTSGVTAISLNATHACAIQAGAVKCWGSGWLGAGRENKTSPVPVQVTGLTAGATAVAVGWRHACAIVAGAVSCWGYNSVGQVGAKAPDIYTPVAVVGLSGPATSIAAGLDVSCAVVNGSVSCWGSGSRLGNGGALKYSMAPVPATGLESGVTAIAANWSHMCAIKSGTVWCWGDNGNGQLGNGVTLGRSGGGSSLVPVAVKGLTGVTSIAVGKSHACAIAKGGVRWCWGSNSGGQLGVVAPSQSSIPVKVTTPKKK